MEINLKEIAEKLKDKELFPESNKRAKELLEKINLNVMDAVINGHETGSFEFRGNVVVYVKDNEVNGYTGWFRDMPAVVGEGETLDELCEALDEAYEMVSQWEKENK